MTRASAEQAKAMLDGKAVGRATLKLSWGRNPVSRTYFDPDTGTAILPSGTDLSFMDQGQFVFDDPEEQREFEQRNGNNAS